MVEKEEHRPEGYECVENCIRVQQGKAELCTENVALEVPVPISYNGVYAEVLSCTPSDFEDAAFGVAFAHGVIAKAEDVQSVEVRCDGSNYDIDMTLRDGLRMPAAQNLSTPSGASSVAGALHSTRIAQLPAYYPAHMVHLSTFESIAPQAIYRASESLLNQQGMHRHTGATHAASFVGRDGEFLHISEDIGRHVAVDKLVGWLLRNDIDPSSGFVFLSSRCALELVNKLARYGVGLVATVSAPTSAVIEFADEANVTLCAFCRQDRFTIYAHPERIRLSR